MGEDKVILKVLGVQDPAVSVYIDSQYKILENYKDGNISVEFDIITWDQYFEKMMKVFNGELLYDIVMIAGHLWLTDFVTKGYLEPLSYDFEDILPVISQEMKYKDQTYLSPSFCDGHMIVYRKSVVEKVLGKCLDEVITVDEFIKTAKVLKESGIEIPIALKAHQSEILTDALPYLRSTGLDIYEVVEGKVVCHIDKMASGIEKYIELKTFAPTDTHTYGNDAIKDLIASGKVAMAVTWSGQLGVVMKDCKECDDLGFATFDTAWNVTWSFGVASTSQNKEQAKRFLGYLRSKEVDRLVGEYCGAPVRKSNYMAGKDKYPWYKTQLKMIEEYAYPLIDLRQAGDKNSVLYEAIYKVFIGDQSIKDALQDTKRRIEEIDA